MVQKKIIVLLLCLFLLWGCDKGVVPIIELTGTETNTQDISKINSRLTTIEEKLSVIEANQLSAEDIRNLFEITNKEESLVSGCPDKEDVIFWTDKFSDGSITQNQLGKILEKYNECN